MSLLTNIFGSNSSPPPSTASLEETKRAEIIAKYQYDFKLSPMQNAYLEMVSRFNGNCAYPKLKTLMTSYRECLKRDSYDKCNDMFFEIKRDQSNEGLDLNRFPFHTFVQRIPFFCIDRNNNINYRHQLAINDLVQECPNYYTPETNPETTEKCYLASLKYWQNVMDLHIETRNSSELFNCNCSKVKQHHIYVARTHDILTKSLNKTNFEQTETSTLLRKYYFNNGTFPYPKGDHLK